MKKQLHTLIEHLEQNAQGEARERKHKETIEYQKQALDTYKGIMDKLLEKL